MARLTRAQQQERTRAAVLVAAREEFAEHGYAEAKVDRIAERAELTRGAVYSNFTGKRALYLAVLADAAERARARAEPPVESPDSVGRALGAFARVWLERLPLAGDTPGSGHLQLRSLSGVLDTEPTRTALAELVRFEALLLALALESRPAARGRMVRPAQLALTLLHGAAGLAENAPGSVTRSTWPAPPSTWPTPPSTTTRTHRTCPSSPGHSRRRTRGRRPEASPTRSPAARSTSPTTAWSSCWA
ncbi:helix-turn-helix domain-containing protein [Streptomyces sp. FXJ1.4098]|nr:helix-turn-helix domain-containing protein [Streptomyces sp. FXJ1.4098]